jgi:hypothetical protein
MLSEDDSVTSAGTKAPANDRIEGGGAPPPPPVDAGKQEKNGKDSGDTQAQTMYLDKTKARTFTIHGPVAITKAEYDRICQWLAVVMIVEEKKEDESA